ncbi:hypothetical protein L3476_06220 [Paenibacillus thiaminolyticus]|uniref:hypothetical protein n=1 Tax=Paenibacillus thiaminolyticus TaxID=49283 RepID=UPI002350A1AC|nr:hypothetical protein [Paenibacillus thiaminolyticus]WCR28337.1 hypothetical protein L3476_06220 [Paenibacillus thiaminolyticus]
MSPHFEELLHSYIILGPFELSRRGTGEIAAVLQDSLSGEVVHIKLLYLRRISPTGQTCLGKWCSFSGRWNPPVFLRRGGDCPFSYSKLGTQSVLNRFFLLRDEIHHTKNEVLKIPLHFLNSLCFAGIPPKE